MQPIIEVKNVSKKYRLSEAQPYYTLRDSLAGLFKNPFTKKNTQLGKDEFWALDDVSFNVMPGEVIGIIGRNGAGKSTLLKILSQITPPTEGEVIMRGRVGSLLEVGTGFSPELTGRENIYLNGAILGMSRAEVRQKFDEIVAFSEVEKFLDTPLKRYSSGMYMRLAFAVAAHLETEILIVDEVLAVGDAEFQKKALGKMGEVTKQGRTVLFVSHNLGTISTICNEGVVFDSGKVIFKGSSIRACESYFRKLQEQNSAIDNRKIIGTLKSKFEINEIIINTNKNGLALVNPKEKIKITVNFYCSENINDFLFTFSIYKEGIRLFSTHDLNKPKDIDRGRYSSSIEIQKFLLRPGIYSLAIGGHKSASWWFYLENAATFEITDVWSEANKQYNVGMINVPVVGSRLKQ